VLHPIAAPSIRPLPLWSFRGLAAVAFLASGALAQQPVTSSATAAAPVTHYELGTSFDLAAMDTKADPCTDFYQFACGKFASTHPIPADQSEVDQFFVLQNVDTQELNGILSKYAVASPDRSPAEKKIGDYYAACMDTGLIDQKDMKPAAALLGEIDRVTKPGLPYLAGELQRMGVNVLFSYGEQQDFKDSTKQVATVDQGGLGLPDRDYYTRSGAKDEEIRQQYVAHIARMLTLAGEPAAQAATDARNILAFETELAKASMTITERRDPENVYHPQTLAEFQSSLHGVPFGPFLEAIHSPHITNLINSSPKFFPGMVEAVLTSKLETLRAYLRFHLLTTYAYDLPARFREEHFDFFGRKLEGQPEPTPRWKRCSYAVNGSLGEALGQIYVQQYFPASDKDSTLEMVHDIEAAMDRDIDTLAWMSPATKTHAKEKLHKVADKIGYPSHWRDYSSLSVAPEDAFGNAQRAFEFENDRELNKIGKPVDRQEWGMTPPTVNAYYDPSMNDINFPAGILQPVFYDPKADLAVNYGHAGSVIGHELTHGFDDEGRKFDGNGNMTDWWGPEDIKKYEARSGCLVKEYGAYTAVDDVKVNGQNTLGENTADNGGLLLAYMAYLDRANKQGLDINAKIDGYTGPQRFYIAWAQNWCENSRPEVIRERAQTDVHSPDHFRANGAVVNQPGFAPAFGCKQGQPMVPADACRVW
jgi:putative endopeptidase